MTKDYVPTEVRWSSGVFYDYPSDYPEDNTLVNLESGYPTEITWFKREIDHGEYSTMEDSKTFSLDQLPLRTILYFTLLRDLEKMEDIYDEENYTLNQSEGTSISTSIFIPQKGYGLEHLFQTMCLMCSESPDFLKTLFIHYENERDDSPLIDGRRDEFILSPIKRK